MAHCLRRDDLELVKGGFDYWDNNLPINRDAIISFIKGIELMLKNNEQLVELQEPYTISSLMCSYLWNKYNIKHLNLDRSIQNLAVIQKKDWVEVFIQVFDDFQKEINWDLGFAKIVRDSIFNTQVVGQIEEGRELDEYKCQDGERIYKGARVQLGNLMKDDYKKTLFFDVDLECPEWDILIPSQRSFQVAKFLHENTLFGNVVAAYSLMTSEVSKIYEVNDRVFIQCKHFQLDIEEAIRCSELLTGQNIVVNENQEWQELNMNKFHEKAENYIMGMISDEELWAGVMGLDIYAPFYGRKDKRRPTGYGYYGTGIKYRWQTGNTAR